MTRLPIPCLALVTDRHRCLGRPLESLIAASVEGGVNLVQLREKDLPAGQLLALARRVSDIVSKAAILFVNDRVDVALACEAQGIQLPEEGLPLESVRAMANDRLLVGRSVHSVEGAVAAADAGADLLVAGTVFPSLSHPDGPSQGLGLIRGIAGRVPVPMLGIGGITPANAATVMEAGASGIAVISAITMSPDPRRAAQELMDVLIEAMAKRPAWKGWRTG